MELGTFVHCSAAQFSRQSFSVNPELVYSSVLAGQRPLESSYLHPTPLGLQMSIAILSVYVGIGDLHYRILVLSMHSHGHCDGTTGLSPPSGRAVSCLLGQ